MSNEKTTTQLTGAFYLGDKRLDTSNAETLAYVRSRFAAKPAQPVEAVDLPNMSLAQLRSSHADSQYGARAGSNESAFHGLAVALLDRAIAALAHPRPTGDGMVSVVAEDANNYCRILTALGMEEEGDPVAEVERLMGIAEAAPTGEQAGEVFPLHAEANDYIAKDWEYQGNPMDTKSKWFLIDFVRNLPALYAAQPSPEGVPDGWKLVPAVATTAMESAFGCMYIERNPKCDMIAFRAGYEAMVAAAPAPEVR